jgi:hypothetical protein
VGEKSMKGGENCGLMKIGVEDVIIAERPAPVWKLSLAISSQDAKISPGRPERERLGFYATIISHRLFVCF